MQGSPTPADVSIARYLLPRLVSFVTNVEPEDPEGARSLVAHSLCLYTARVEQDRVPPAMALIIPALMTRATAEREELYQETSARLLALAAIDQEAFRGIVGAMSAAQRGLLEEVIRSGRQDNSNSNQSSADDSGQPTIALKMNFGS